MKIGTKSVLYGAHCFLLHPVFVAIAWVKLYGWPWDPRIWIAFFVHDLGYIGKPNMNGPEGETHVELGAKIMHFLFDIPKWHRNDELYSLRKTCDDRINPDFIPYVVGPIVFSKKKIRTTKWRDFCLYHSRYYAKQHGAKPSRLCFADKLSFCYTPRWLYLPMVKATGEINEYLEIAKTADGGHWKPVTGYKAWHKQLSKYMWNWVEVHKDGRLDTWTTSNRNDK